MKRWGITFAAVIIVGSAGFLIRWKMKAPEEAPYRPTPVERGTLQVTVLATGIVEPQNRVEIKPPIPGRAEDILVKEGESVRKGQILAWMSSTERAALLDAARAKGEKEVAHWENLYRAAPLIAPLTGIVIARNVEPGQTMTAQDAVLVMANRLIVRAQVDETDIGKVAVGQPAEISLDAYPDDIISGRVDHIAYEAATVNNVTIYRVEVAPDSVPPAMRSGMTANVTFTIAEKKNALIVPAEAVAETPRGAMVLVASNTEDAPPEEREVELGLSNGRDTEIVSGLSEGESVLLKSFSLGGSRGGGTNPFMPSRRQNRRRR